MELKEIMYLISVLIWPAVLGWNVYLFKTQQKQEKSLSDFKFFIAEKYISKRDLERMFLTQTEYLDKRLDMFETLITKLEEVIK